MYLYNCIYAYCVCIIAYVYDFCINVVTEHVKPIKFNKNRYANFFTLEISEVIWQ